MRKFLIAVVSMLFLICLCSCDFYKITDLVSGEDTDRTENIHQVEIEWEGEPYEFASHDDSILRDDYYRYNKLQRDEQNLYDDIYDAVLSGVNVLDISSYGFSGDDIEKIYRVFISDNPALFYVSRTCKYLYSKDDGIVSDILLMYTDGEVTDKYNDECKLVKTADRKIIADKIDRLEKSVNRILKDIPEELTAVEKEKLIHDYIVANTEYNKSDISLYENNDTVPHIFDAYGALCEREAVCEGYAKAFQLLCYEAGILCVQVEGSGSSTEHMWNMVLLDQWYHVDVTWDDGSENNLPYYAYFNIPDDICFRDHRVTDTVHNFVPECNGEKFSYYNYYCARITSSNMPPENYKQVADAIAHGKLDYVIIYSNSIDVTDAYLKEHFLDTESCFMRYVNKKGYNISLKWEYVAMGDYYYIPLE